MPTQQPELFSDNLSNSLPQLMEKLTAPFSTDAVKFKPAVVSGNRAMAIAYVDARVIQDRLDEVLGVLNWQDEYEFLSDGSVVCRLRLRIGEEWITKMDVGGQSGQPDEGDRRKAAVSDALKRAAVKFGVGRYLYRLPTMWVEYDPKKKRIVKPPILPNGKNDVKPAVSPKAPAKPSAKPVSNLPKPVSNLPKTGEELRNRLHKYDERLTKEKLISENELIHHVVDAAVEKGFDSDMSTWNEEAIKLAVEETKAFETSKRKKTKQEPQKVA